MDPALSFLPSFFHGLCKYSKVSCLISTYILSIPRIFHSGFTNSYCYRKLISISFLILLVTLIACEDRTPLGLRNGLIRDDQISASSTYDKPELQPNFARLGNYYPWCSGGNKSPGEEYLQVFLFIMLLMLSAGRLCTGVRNQAEDLVTKFSSFIIQVYHKIFVDYYRITSHVLG